jgi:5-methylcytosine-specific restriction protein A
MASPFRRPCLTCGHPTQPGQSRCPPHQLEADRPRNQRKNTQRGNTPHATHARQQINNNGGGYCHQCGIGTYLPAAHLEVDHITPLADGGTDTPPNIQTLCKPHQRTKTATEAARRLASPPRTDTP